LCKPSGLEVDGCFSTVDAACAILFRHPTLLELMGRLLAEPIKQQLPVGLGD
jgi:hypothetical protein